MNAILINIIDLLAPLHGVIVDDVKKELNLELSGNEINISNHSFRPLYGF